MRRFNSWIVVLLILVLLILATSCINDKNNEQPNVFNENSELNWIIKDSLLVINGNGKIPSYDNYTNAPWYSQKSKIKEVKISEGITEIGRFNFYSINNLSKVILPQTLVYIGANAFQYCKKLDGINFPSNLRHIDIYSFASCESLKNLIIPNSLQEIEARAFILCSSLDSINVISSNLFSSEKGVLFNKQRSILICYPAGRKDSTYIIPNNIRTIGNDAFFGNNYLKTIIISDSVQNIGKTAFSECHGLSIVQLGKSLNEIGYEAFENCPNLKSFQVDFNNKHFSSQSGVLYDKNKTKLIRYPTSKTISSFEIPIGVETIGGGAFAKCNNLERVLLPKSITKIDGYAFYMCENILAIKIDGNKLIENIDNFAFDGMNKNAKFIVSESVKSEYKASDKFSKFTID
ncbi:MAG TPA: leucine-rich repeat domain-containing protein [Edaphocola sp.]|nr:leucine-rich repeat domain-containing protein [Edaphocola sp.]